MKKNIYNRSRSVTLKSGFTLLELIVAMLMLTIAMSIAFQAFSSTLRGYKRGSEVAEGIKHGDYAISQLARAINSTMFFHKPEKNYAFLFEKQNKNGLPADSLSFVTTSPAFLPPNSPFIDGPHRINLFIDDDEGAPALFVEAMPPLQMDDMEENDFETDPFLVSRAVQGLEILVWDKEKEDWDEEWDYNNSVPERILIRVYVVSDNEEEEPMEFVRVIDIPAYQAARSRISGPTERSYGVDDA